MSEPQHAPISQPTSGACAAEVVHWLAHTDPQRIALEVDGQLLDFAGLDHEPVAAGGLVGIGKAKHEAIVSPERFDICATGGADAGGDGHGPGNVNAAAEGREDGAATPRGRRRFQDHARIAMRSTAWRHYAGRGRATRCHRSPDEQRRAALTLTVVAARTPQLDLQAVRTCRGLMTKRALSHTSKPSIRAVAL